MVFPGGSSPIKAREQHLFSLLISHALNLQDLELWIAKERLEDGYNLITRAGRTVQELKVTTDVPLDAMKSAVQAVLRRLA